MADWLPSIGASGKPVYLEIADSIEQDIESGHLQVGDRLPTQRSLASQLAVDYTTISRGFAEAAKRGLITSHVGRGTFVRSRQDRGLQPYSAADVDLTMNLPPDVTDPIILRRMRAGLDEVSTNLVSLLRYQSTIGSDRDRSAAAEWLSRRGLPVRPDCLAITPGAHATIVAILSGLARPGDTVLCEEVTYPGIRSIAARMGLILIGVPGDDEGVMPEALEKAIRQHSPKAIYFNPTLQNPTTQTIPLPRREALSEVIVRHGTPLIEDDAYGLIATDPPPAFAAIIPEITSYISSLSKCLGAGLRLAFTLAPSAHRALALAQVLRASNIMPSPISAALAAAWIEDGTADSIREALRQEARARQAIAAEIFKGHAVQADREAFNIWLKLPPGTGRADLMGRVSGRRLGVMPSDAFTVTKGPSEHVRVVLGGPMTREDLRIGLTLLKETLGAGNWVG